MSGTQTGVDLRFNKATQMDWKEYSGRINDDSMLGCPGCP